MILEKYITSSHLPSSELPPKRFKVVENITQRRNYLSGNLVLVLGTSFL